MRLQTPGRARGHAAGGGGAEGGVRVKEPSRSFEHCRILHVEDNPDDAFLFKRALQKIGFTGDYEWVDSAEKALARLANGATPDVIVADGYHAAGPDSLHRFRQALKRNDVPIIVYSGDLDWHAMPEALRNGATGYLLKGNSFEASLVAVRRILDQCL
jgi:DNA-binding NtrC family response regulator